MGTAEGRDASGLSCESGCAGGCVAVEGLAGVRGGGGGREFGGRVLLWLPCWRCLMGNRYLQKRV